MKWIVVVVLVSSIVIDALPGGHHKKKQHSVRLANERAGQSVQSDRISAGDDSDWDPLDRRPLPKWFDEAKFGIFIHWGVFSVPSFGEWFWYNWATGSKAYVEFMKANYPPNFTYAEFAGQFRAEFFNPDQWADILQSSGAKYVVLTSKHHEGYTLWPSKYSFNWNSVDVGPRRDLVGDLAKSVRARTELKFGVYHSLYEWFHPLYLADRANGFQTRHFVLAKTLPELYELVDNYRPEVIWSDGDWEADHRYWGSIDFLTWLYTQSPVNETVVVNDRWGIGANCKHGDFLNCKDRFNPGKLQERKWENAMTIDRAAWAYRRNAQLADFLTTDELIETLVVTVSFGGNLLMNVGPTADGLIKPIFEERLRQVGSWLKINGEAIYSTRPWTCQNDTLNGDVWYTYKSTGEANAIYAITLKWPECDRLRIGAPVPVDAGTVVTLLGYKKPLKWHLKEDHIEIHFPSAAAVTGKWAWVVKFTQLESFY